MDKPMPCHLCGRPPVSTCSAIRGSDGLRIVAASVGCPGHLVGRVEVVGVSDDYALDAALVGWNEYQSGMAAQLGRAS